MKPRKTVLLSAIAVLLCVYIVQLVTSGHGAIKDIKLADKPDTILITQGTTTITLAEENGAWVVGDQKYPADQKAVDGILSAISNVKVLDTVGKTGKEAVLDRYELGKEKAITVKATKSGKDLRTLTVGKDATTSSQSYVTLNGGSNIYLVSGSLHTIFGKSANELRSSVVYSLKYDDMTKVTVGSPEGNWALEKSGSPAAWTLAPGSVGGVDAEKNSLITVDPEKAAAWAKDLAEIDVNSWLDDSATLPDTKPTSVTITAGGKDITVTIYPSGSGKDVKYLGTSSATPYKFELGAYAGMTLTKKLGDLKK